MNGREYERRYPWWMQRYGHSPMPKYLRKLHWRLTRQRTRAMIARHIEPPDVVVPVSEVRNMWY